MREIKIKSSTQIEMRMENLGLLQTEQGALNMQDLDTMDVSIMLLSQRLARLENIVKRLAFQSDVDKLAEDIKGMKQFGGKEMLTVNEISEYLGLSKATIYKLTSSHKITYSKPEGKTIYISKGDLLDWMRSGRVMSNAEIDAVANQYVTKNKINPMFTPYRR